VKAAATGKTDFPRLLAFEEHGGLDVCARIPVSLSAACTYGLSASLFRNFPQWYFNTLAKDTWNLTPQGKPAPWHLSDVCSKLSASSLLDSRKRWVACVVGSQSMWLSVSANLDMIPVSDRISSMCSDLLTVEHERHFRLELYDACATAATFNFFTFATGDLRRPPEKTGLYPLNGAIQAQRLVERQPWGFQLYENVTLLW